VEWNVLKRYRTWQASRRAFLYPENYLEPEQRDDKEPLFEPDHPDSTARSEKLDDDP
jgi:ABC toxin-like protein